MHFNETQKQALFPAPDQILSVADFTGRLKRLLEGSVPPCWVRGEVSNLRRQSSGHVYFTLKDAQSQLSAVMFRGDASRQSLALKDGMQVLVYGELSLYELRGAYQLIVRFTLGVGEGALQLAFERLKQQLKDEGLFAPERKQPLPLLPQRVAIITSPTGAAIHDFISILRRRGWLGELTVLPAPVQGEGASNSILERLHWAEASERFDLIVLSRGGGSLEDLWAFNEERLVRAVADCSLPTISAVGHETDFSLCDFAADVRAETPSGAAELISSRFLACTERLVAAREDLVRGVNRLLERGSLRLTALRNSLLHQSPAEYVERLQLRLDLYASRLEACTRQDMHSLKKQLDHLDLRLKSMSVERTLARGFVALQDEEGQYIVRSAQVRLGEPIKACFSDGCVQLEATHLD
jgi:exodeoxyribonuclease VII large subunit